MLIHVQGGKGAKDRYAMLSPRLLDILRAYWKRARPGLWLFPGRESGEHVGVAALQDACRVARGKVRFGKPVTTHSLRHSFSRLRRGLCHVPARGRGVSSEGCAVSSPFCWTKPRSKWCARSKNSS